MIRNSVGFLDYGVIYACNGIPLSATPVNNKMFMFNYILIFRRKHSIDYLHFILSVINEK